MDSANVETGVNADDVDQDVSDIPQTTKDTSEESPKQDEPEERWYAAQDGSYFTDRRDPFFYFNLCSYVVTMGIFVYLGYAIIEDYIDQQRDPPTSTKLELEIDQLFPGIIICNIEKNVSLQLLSATFDNSTSQDGYDISDQVKPLGCDDLQESSCLSLDGAFPAFQFETSKSNVRITSRNTISMILDVDIDSYSNKTFFAGVDGYLHRAGESEYVRETVCLNPFLPSTEVCPEDEISLSLDQFRASTNAGTFVALAKREIQSGSDCGHSFFQWDPDTTTMTLNEKAVEVGISNSLVLMEFQFYTSAVARTSFNPLSAQSMFGSLSGWFGFLTDGWGVISVTFFAERTFLFLRDRYRA